MRRAARTVRDRLLVATASLILAGCAGASAPEPLVAVRPEPVSDDVRAELLRIEDARLFDTARLHAYTRSPAAPVRARSALALGRLMRAEARPLLERLLLDGDTAVAATAAFALGEIGDTMAVPSLVRRLADSRPNDQTVRAEVASALGMLRTTRSEAALTELLAEGDPASPDTLVSGAALLAAWRFPRPADIGVLLRWTGAREPAVRWRAAYALVRRPEPRAVQTMLSLAADPDARVRALALRSLTAAQVDSSGANREGALARLLAGLRDPDYSVRINAARALGSYREPLVADSLRALLGRSGDPHLAVTALEAIGRLGPLAASTAGELRTMVGHAEAPVFLRQSALDALIAVDPAAAVEMARRLEGSPAWRLRAAAGRAFAATPAAREGLERVLRDRDPRVATAALDAAIAAVGDSLSRLRPVLVEAVGSRDPMMRASALGALGKLRDAALAPLFLDAYEVAQADSANDAALAAVAALGMLQSQSREVARAFFARFRRSRDDLVRRAVRSAFGAEAGASWGQPLPLDSVPPADWYRRLVEELPVGDAAPEATVVTQAGTIRLRLFSADAPLTVHNFLRLAERGYFDGQEWPRVVPNFVVQGGDPRGDTNGGPGYVIRDEINRRRYGAGTLGMALSGPDTGGSQFFMTHSPQPHLDGIYTVFGEVVEGQRVLEQILPGDRIVSIRRVK